MATRAKKKAGTKRAVVAKRTKELNGRVLTIRSEDLRAIACLFETSADHMRRRLDELGVRL